MTLTRGLTVSVLALLATVVLVGYAGPIGLMVWLGVVALAGCAPDHAWKIVTTFQPGAVPRWISAGWQWLDRR